jgi:hypothetical protein
MSYLHILDDRVSDLSIDYSNFKSQVKFDIEITLKELLKHLDKKEDEIKNLTNRLEVLEKKESKIEELPTKIIIRKESIINKKFLRVVRISEDTYTDVEYETTLKLSQTKMPYAIYLTVDLSNTFIIVHDRNSLIFRCCGILVDKKYREMTKEEEILISSYRCEISKPSVEIVEEVNDIMGKMKYPFVYNSELIKFE